MRYVVVRHQLAASAVKKLHAVVTRAVVAPLSSRAWVPLLQAVYVLRPSLISSHGRHPFSAAVNPPRRSIKLGDPARQGLREARGARYRSE